MLNQFFLVDTEEFWRGASWAADEERVGGVVSGESFYWIYFRKIVVYHKGFGTGTYCDACLSGFQCG